MRFAEPLVLWALLAVPLLIALVLGAGLRRQSFSATSKPSTLGSCTSQITRSGDVRRTDWRPSSPSIAVKTSCPNALSR